MTTPYAVSTAPTNAGAFEVACTQVSSGELGQLSNEDRLSLYGLYSVARKGPATGSGPSPLDFRAYSKFQAWVAVSELSREDAMERYIDLVGELAKRNVKTNASQRSGGLGRLAPTGFDIGAETANTEHDLCHWASTGDVKSLKYLLHTKGVSPDYRDEMGLTALMRAADRNFVRVIDILIRAGTDINAQDPDGLTALHYAAYVGHAEASGVLVLYGANLDIADSDGNTPLDAADSTAKHAILSAQKGEWKRPALHVDDVEGKRFSMDNKAMALVLVSLSVLVIAIGFAGWRRRLS